MVLPNGVVKTTWAHRLDDLNDFVYPFLQPVSHPIHLLDVAASSGVASCEWYEQLTKRGIDCSMVATDKVVHGSLFHAKPGIEALFDCEQNVIHLGILGRGMPPSPKFPYRIVTDIAKAYIRLMKWSADNSTCIDLVTKRASYVPSIRFVETDLLAEYSPELLEVPFDVVRAANILNRGYFAPETIRTIVTRLKSVLREGGLLVVCRTEGAGTNNATVFKLIESQFTEISSLRGGAEVTDLVLSA